MPETQKIPVSVYAEMTPNPAVLKFVANKQLIEIDSVEFRNIEEAQPSPLAVKLFHFPFVKEVFVSGNYVAITKFDIVEWEDITMEIRELIRDYIASGTPILKEDFSQKIKDEPTEIPAQAKEYGGKNPEDFDDFEKKIVQILDEYVTPAVAQDGGNIRFLGHENGVVRVLLQGACSGCPSSTMTLKQGIQNLLQEMLPGQIQDVQAVNG